MKKILPIFILLAIISCDNNSHENSTQNYENTKVTLETQEAESPTKFLKISGTYRKNLVGKTVIEGTIYSNAAVTTFKDVTIEVNFISRTGSIINTDNYIIYEYIKPNRSADFKLKINAPRATESVSIHILNAKS